jgi:hypothetical protein
MKGPIIYGLTLAGGCAVIALVIVATRRASRAAVPANTTGEELAGTDRSRPRATRAAFVFLVWAGAWVAVVGGAAARSMWLEADEASASRTTRRVDADLARATNRSNAALLLAAAAVGLGASLTGCCGVRSGRGAAMTLVGGVLGLILNLALGLAAIAHYVYFGVELLKGPFV